MKITTNHILIFGFVFGFGLIVYDISLRAPERQAEEFAFQPSKPIPAKKREQPRETRKKIYSTPKVYKVKNQVEPDEFRKTLSKKELQNLGRQEKYVLAPNNIKPDDLKKMLSLSGNFPPYQQPKSWNQWYKKTKKFKVTDLQTIEWDDRKREPATDHAPGFQIKDMDNNSRFRELGLKVGDNLYLCNYVNMRARENILSCLKNLVNGNNLVWHIRRGDEDKVHIVDFGE